MPLSCWRLTLKKEQSVEEEQPAARSLIARLPTNGLLWDNDLSLVISITYHMVFPTFKPASSNKTEKEYLFSLVVYFSFPSFLSARV